MYIAKPDVRLTRQFVKDTSSKLKAIAFSRQLLMLFREKFPRKRLVGTC
jgi:hypothetical protein